MSAIDTQISKAISSTRQRPSEGGEAPLQKHVKLQLQKKPSRGSNTSNESNITGLSNLSPLLTSYNPSPLHTELSKTYSNANPGNLARYLPYELQNPKGKRDTLAEPRANANYLRTPIQEPRTKPSKNDISLGKMRMDREKQERDKMKALSQKRNELLRKVGKGKSVVPGIRAQDEFQFSFNEPQDEKKLSARVASVSAKPSSFKQQSMLVEQVIGFNHQCEEDLLEIGAENEGLMYPFF
jgi:hypothetical protein